jgi:hypothetical protein
VAVGTTFDSNITRNGLIESAYRTIGVLSPGVTLTGELLNEGIEALNLIVRELDETGKWLWGVSSTPSAVTLVANTFIYTSSNGLPTNILELTSAVYRDGSAQDWPLTVLTSEGYDALQNKTDTGDPSYVYLTTHRDIGSQTLFVGPMLTSVNTQSVVTGTDAATYRCIKSHTATTDNRPVTGANYLLYWEAGGSGPATWAADTEYTAPQQVRLRFKRPLFDFDTASDNPDFPKQYHRMLKNLLAADLSDGMGMSLEERAFLIKKAKASYDNVFRSHRTNTNDTKNKVKYF